MPRDGSGTYNKPFPDVVGDTTIESAVFNGNTADVEQDLNTPRPIVAGGTGATNAHDAMVALSGEIANQVVTNYDTHPFAAGSFHSNTPATGEPGAEAFAGICYLNDPNYIILEARGWSSKEVFVRRKLAGVWEAWTREIIPAPTTPSDPANKAYVDAGDAAANAAAAAAQGTANTANAAAGTAQTTANNAASAASTAQTAANNANANANTRLLRTTDTFTGTLTVTGDIAGGGIVVAGNGPLYSRSNGNPIVYLQDQNGTPRSQVFYNRATNSLDMFGPATTSVSIPANGKMQASNGIQSKAGYSGGYGTVCYNLSWNGSKFVLYADDINLGVVPLMADITELEDRLNAALARIEALERQLVPA
jgi:hypothetical protein